MLLGQAAATRGDAEAAARHYREAVLELSSIGSDRGAAEAWFELGGLLDELGLEREAHDAYRSAAASTGLVSFYSARTGATASRLTERTHGCGASGTTNLPGAVGTWEVVVTAQTC